ncbi:MAG: MBL fold metallo-hydrolase [Betaproteobacteria bacterium]|nr:MBL fold metallo-hydrolase [Betaproteobacteria bacterium]
MAGWKIGTATVTRIEELVGLSMTPPGKHFPGFERDILERHLNWLAPDHYSPEHDCMVSSFHSWLIRTEHHTILLDTCCGNHKDRPWAPRFNQLDTPYMDRLRAAGVAPEDIDIVFCTHLHADHVGWNTVQRDGRWVPTFPNAYYLFSKTEADYWNQRSNPAMKDDPRRVVYADSVLPVVESGQAVLIDGNHALEDGILIEPAPGHTPGLIILKLDQPAVQARRGEPGERAIFCGDVIHHALQVHAPHWAHIVDQDPATAKSTRRKLLEHCVESGALLFPAHFGAPHVAQIVEADGGFAPRFVTAG